MYAFTAHKSHILQVTSMLAASKIVLFLGTRVIIKVSGHQYWWLAGGYDLEIGHFYKWLV